MNNKLLSMFLFITFFITWAAWFIVIFMAEPLSPGSPTYLLYGLGGLLGPLVASFVAMRFFNTKIAYGQFLRELFKININFGWYAIVLLFPFVLGLMPFIIELLSNGTFLVKLDPPYYTVLLMLPMMILGGGLEEIGWRGVLLPELMKKYSALTATIIVSFIWAIWHLPLWFIAGTVQHDLNLFWFILSILGTSLLISAVYINTKSVFLCILLHALFNANAAYFQPTAAFSSWNESVTISIKLIICIGLFIVLVNKHKTQSFSVAGGELK